MKRIKAFTLMEVIIVMLITAVLVSMTYSIFSVFKREFSRFSEKITFSNDIMALDEAIKLDLDRSDSVTYKADSLILSFPAAGRSLVSYRFAPEYIVRISSRTDTLFKGQTFIRVVAMDSIRAKEVKVAAKWKIALKSKDRAAFELEYHKTYPSDAYMNGTL